MTFSQLAERFIEILENDYGKSYQNDISVFRALEIVWKILEEENKSQE